MVNLELLPNLRTDGFEQTSEHDEAYNCVAHALGVTDEWIDPFGSWPDDLPPDDTIENLTSLFVARGFVICDNGTPENGFEKIAIFGIDESYQHVAKLQTDGRWSSKLGPDEDIAHKLESIAGDFYGQVVRYLKRSKNE